MTSEGGKFANLMENSAGTWPQRLSNIQDTLFQKMNEFGNKYKEVFEFGIGTAEDLVESLDDVLAVMGGLIAAYGTYKAALITAAVAQKAVGFVESIRLIGMYRKELGLATAAQQAFNLAAKSNVYVTLLAALVGIGTAVYMFSKNADDATTSQGKLNLALAESEKASLSEQRELAKLKGELSALKKGTDEYNEVKDKIVKGFSKYYAGLDEEIERVGLTEQAYNRLTDAITKSYGARQYEKFKSTQTEELDSLMSENLSKIQERLIDKLGEEEGSKYYTKIRNAILEGSVKAINGTFNLSGLDKETNAALDKVAGKGGLLVNRSVEQYIANILNAIKSTEKLDKLARERFGVDGIKSSAGTGKEDLPKSTISEEINDATKRIKILRQEIADLRSGKLQAEAGKTVESAISAKEKELQSAEKTLETLTGISRKEESKKVTDNQQNLAEELLQLRFKNQQDEINLMKEGSDKKRRQIELDYQKEIDAYNKAKEKYGETDEVKSMKSNADNKRSTGLAAINEEEQKKEQERIKAQEDAWNEALIKFGDYNQKRKAIIEKYDKEIEHAQNAGDEWAKTEEKKAALEELDEQYGKSTRVMADLFEDAGEKSVTAIQKIIDKYETLVKYLSGTEQSDGTPVTLDELKAIGFTDKDIESIERGEISIRDLTDALKNLNGGLEGKSPWMSFVNDMQKSIGKIKSAKGDSEKIGEGVMGIGNAVTDFAPALGEFAENIGSIFGVDGEKIQGIVGSIQGLGQTATGVGQILSGDVVGGAMSAVGGISKVVSSLEGLFGADYSEYENMKAQYDTLISVWDTLIGKKTEYIDIDYGAEAQKAADEAIRLTETQIERQRQLANMLAGSGASVGSHSLGYRVNDRMSSQDWRRLSGLVGQQVGSLGDVFSLDADIIGKVLQDEHFVSVLTSVNSEFIDYISNIESYAEQLEEIAEKEKEALTGVGLDDFRNGYSDLLADLDSDNQDFADDFEKYLQNAIFSSLVANKYKERIEKLYNQWADYTDSGGKLTGDEAEQLRNEYQNIVDNMLAEREQIMKEFGWTSSSSSGQQSASSRGFGTEMTHEDAGELSGRFTAVYESNLRIEAAEQQQTVAITELRGSISELTAKANGLYNIADETRTILANSYLELQQIRENTGEIVEPIKKMQKDISEVKKNTSKL